MIPQGFRPRIAAVLPGLLVVSGCSDDRAHVVVATPWDRATCIGLAATFRDKSPAPAPPIRWIRLAPWDDPARLLSARGDVDVLLGWPAMTLEGLRLRGLIAPSDPESQPIPLAPPAGSMPALRAPIGDPRLDADARSAVAWALDRGDWRDGYALLIAGAAEDTPPGGAPPAGAALAIGEDRPEARAFLDFVSTRLAALPAEGPIDPASARVAAELIGATTIDAALELRSAWVAAGRSPDAEAGRAALVEPPPWPPASIQELRADPGRRALAATLAGAIVEGSAARGWLLASWERPPRPIDRALIVELATIDGGRLLDEPHVLPWLRAEWTAWARQRFARIARELEQDPGGDPR